MSSWSARAKKKLLGEAGATSFWLSPYLDMCASGFRSQHCPPKSVFRDCNSNLALFVPRFSKWNPKRVRVGRGALFFLLRD